MPHPQKRAHPTATSDSDSGSMVAMLRGKRKLAVEKSPHHHRVISKDGHNGIDGEHDRKLNGYQKSLFLNRVHHQLASHSDQISAPLRIAWSRNGDRSK